ncbi:MAG: InlB B-repeat-containing protein [bacterium]|nr:InlB B-repeat-containing protein [bacterium]
MRNAGWKRLLAMVLVLMMTLSLMPAAFADGDVACTLTEGCTLAAGHEGACVLQEKEDEGEEPSAAVQAFLDAVAAIVIPENPEEMDEDSVAALEKQLEVASDAYEALSEEELEREDVLAACAVMSAALDLLDGGIGQYEAHDWDPTTDPNNVAGTLVEEKYYTSSFTFNISTSTTAQLRAMPILSDGYYSYNAMAYCGATATSNNKSVIDVQNITIGTYSGGDWDGADCLQINGELKGPGTATVTANYYYTFSQSSDPFNNSQARWYYANHTFNIQVNMDHTLSYDANGGTGAPASQTKTVAASSYDFTVSSTEPTRENHTFLGWAESADAQTAQYHANDKVTVEGSKTLYAVWEENTPPSPSTAPTAPSNKEVEDLLNANAVTVDCVNADADHTDRTYGLLADSYSIGEVDAVSEVGYFCTITVSAAPYVNKYNSDVASGHSLVTGDPNSQKFTLKYKANDSSWYRPPADAPAATFTVECENEEIVPPAKPTNDKVKSLLGETAVTIDCVNANFSHANETYGLLDGSFTVGDVEENVTDLFTCTVTIQARPYVEAYNNDVAPGHSLATDETPSKTVTLTYDADEKKWSVPANAVPVVFQVVCGASQPDTDWSKLTITKTVSPTGTVMPGDIVTHTITVTNNTGKPLSDITVSDALDSRLELISAIADQGSYDFTNGSWSFPTGVAPFTAGSSATLTITAKVKADATGTINNTATITGAQDDGNGLPQGSGGSSSVSIKVGTPAPMKKFTLSYNANGGKGAPSSQSVETTANSVVMTVSSVKPTRDGYHFCGWALTPNGHVSYRPGNEITLTGDVTLYAVWATRTGSPQTGDSSNIALWAAMAGMSLAAGAVVLLVLKKRKAE